MKKETGAMRRRNRHAAAAHFRAFLGDHAQNRAASRRLSIYAVLLDPAAKVLAIHS
jgi:hypothetical protein